jgi:hypothetical protein
MAFKISPEVFGIGRDSPAFPPLVVFVSELCCACGFTEDASTPRRLVRHGLADFVKQAVWKLI